MQAYTFVTLPAPFMENVIASCGWDIGSYFQEMRIRKVPDATCTCSTECLIATVQVVMGGPAPDVMTQWVL